MKTKRIRKMLTGYRPVVHARQGLMLGIRQPLDGPIFEKLEHAEFWCWEVMVDHYDRRLGMSMRGSSRSKAWLTVGHRRTRLCFGTLNGFAKVCDEVNLPSYKYPLLFLHLATPIRYPIYRYPYQKKP